MKKVSGGIGFASLVLLGAAVIAQQERATAPAKPPAELVKVSMGDPDQRGDLNAAVGDLIQFEMPAPALAPGQNVRNLTAQLKGNTARYVTTANTPNIVNGRAVPGGGAISVFLLAERAGDVGVTITPWMDQGGKGQPKTYQLRVAAQRQPRDP